jgi:hypothetical protein
MPSKYDPGDPAGPRAVRLVLDHRGDYSEWAAIKAAAGDERRTRATGPRTPSAVLTQLQARRAGPPGAAGADRGNLSQLSVRASPATSGATTKPPGGGRRRPAGAGRTLVEVEP